MVCAALVAVNPLFVWYSQEARAYGLFVLMAALAMLCFLRALREPTRARMAAFALAGALALLTHYFAVFLLIPMALWLLCERAHAPRGAAARSGCWRSSGAALLPLISAQGGHGTQWIGQWPLSRTAAGDPPVLPDRLLRLAARTRRRAARRAADPRRARARAVAHDRARARAATTDAEPAAGC